MWCLHYSDRLVFVLVMPVAPAIHRPWEIIAESNVNMAKLEVIRLVQPSKASNSIAKCFSLRHS